MCKYQCMKHYHLLSNNVHVVKGRQYSVYMICVRCPNHRDGVLDRLSTSIVTDFDASSIETNLTAQYNIQTSARSWYAAYACMPIHGTGLDMGIRQPREHVKFHQPYLSEKLK
jgi:hypothetical protein